MWECFIHNIQLLFLLLHTLHILQLLNLAVFLSLKTLYRKQVKFLSLLTNSTPIEKRNFLQCYYKARLDALTARNIQSGWQAAGLWPVNSAKSLLSQLLLKNSNTLEEKVKKCTVEKPLSE